MQATLLRRLHRWREALILLGLGGVVAPAARANTRTDRPDIPADATLLMHDGLVTLSERGGAFEPLQLGESDAGRSLQKLLQQRGAAPIGLAPTVIADGAQAFTLQREAQKPTPGSAAKASTAPAAKRKPSPGAGKARS